MRPLYYIAIGLSVVVFTSAPDGVLDVAEIFGQGLVLLGWWLLARALPDLAFRLTLTYLAVAAFAVAVAVAWPDARAWLEDDADSALLWASSLPTLAFQALLCLALGRRAQEAGSTSRPWWYAAGLAILVALVAGVLHEGAGWAWLDGTGAVGLLGALLVIVLCAWHGAAAWAGGGEPEPEGEASAAQGGQD